MPYRKRPLYAARFSVLTHSACTIRLLSTFGGAFRFLASARSLARCAIFACRSRFRSCCRNQSVTRFARRPSRSLRGHWSSSNVNAKFDSGVAPATALAALSSLTAALLSGVAAAAPSSVFTAAAPAPGLLSPIFTSPSVSVGAGFCSAVAPEAPSSPTDLAPAAAASASALAASSASPAPGCLWSPAGAEVELASPVAGGAEPPSALLAAASPSAFSTVTVCFADGFWLNWSVESSRMALNVSLARRGSQPWR
mmetsp:Transcript_3702/g.11502  ORF Transcript_3702/g.11502 Transcript_3702/m.11502 type:complete len:254 (+) Transcript_3702:616-1377(+)